MRTGAILLAIALAAIVCGEPVASAWQSTGTPLAPGDEARGAEIFAGKAACQTCHRVRDKGSRVGPDLTDIGANRTPEQLRASLLEPDTEILPENRTYRVVTRSGETITGRLLNLDTYQVLLIDPKEQLRSFSRADLREHDFVRKSPMPSYRERLSPQELADVLAYLAALKGVTPQ